MISFYFIFVNSPTVSFYCSYFKPYLFLAKSDGRTCEYNNKIYQNGEIFRPNCKHQCTCMDGAVGCVSLCPHQLTLPKLGCAKPQRVKVQGRCCEQLACHGEAKTESGFGNKHSKKHSKDRRFEDDLNKKNELAPVWKGESNSLPGEQLYTISFYSGDAKGNVCAGDFLCIKQLHMTIISKVQNAQTKGQPKDDETRH